MDRGDLEDCVLGAGAAGVAAHNGAGLWQVCGPSPRLCFVARRRCGPSRGVLSVGRLTHKVTDRDENWVLSGSGVRPERFTQKKLIRTLNYLLILF